jgi:hypothetical protein
MDSTQASFTNNASSPMQPCSTGRLGDLVHGLSAYYLTSLIAVSGVVFGQSYLQAPRHSLAKQADLLGVFANWDGNWYVKIARDGYRYDAAQPSNIAFFPAFPLLGRWLANLTGLRIEAALLIIAHLSLAATFVLLAAYVRLRSGANTSERTTWALVAFGLWPTTMFCRVAYSESLFLFGAVTALYGMERRWPVVLIALTIGLATATRSVGVCLLIPFAWHVWQISIHSYLTSQNRSSGDGQAAARLGKIRIVLGVLRRVWLVPVACWGLLAFMLFQYIEFGEPLAFAHTQENWRFRPAVTPSTRVVELVTLEPVWSVFDPDSSCYWQRSASDLNPLFSLHLANPLYWLAALALIGVGIWKRSLTSYEWSLALGLLLVPYVLRSHDMCMASMGRFTAVVFPIYLVMGQLLARLPVLVAALLVALSGFFLGAYAALFAAWYRVF